MSLPIVVPPVSFGWNTQPELQMLQQQETPPAGDTPPADPPAGEQTPPAEGTPPAGESAPAGDTPPWGSDEDFDPKKAWQLIQNLRSDKETLTSSRTTAVKDAETAAERRAREEAYKEIGKTLGVVSDDETPTVEGLSSALQDKDSALTQTQADLQAVRIENAILRHADRFGGDVDALTDSESFKKKLRDLDPTAADHASQVEALVKSSIESNTRFRKVQVAASNSNGEPSPTGAPPAGPKSIDELRKERRDRRS
ncbi:hypothetical protein ACFPRL_27185 [Pseudoclavibacter helvolus]|uniref:hypothetical protein n=1 Tax=Pseudoclavibacter helvolus TaxID=255205 RepID=UPI0035F0E8D3